MNINDILMTPQMVADLYRSTLVETGEDPAHSLPQEKKEELASTLGWKSLGDNKKNILIIVQYKDAVHIPDGDLDFLTTMLAACKTGLTDVAILNLNNHPGASYKELTAFFKSKIVLLFDTEPSAFGLPMNFPHYQLQAFANATFLYSPSLTDLENDKLQKSKLWVCLKRLFNL
ncbi:MAG: hypothetical protein HOP10_05745 [Chitinophagaceae bacterium]|nr:hypothetical protein [Chitinophagaceae bacterium]